MSSCNIAKWAILALAVNSQIPDHLLTGINELFHGGAYAYYHKDYTTTIRELEKALINYKMRQGIESSCHTKCEYADVRATKFDDEGLELNWGSFDDSETLHFIRQLERATCLKDCIAEHPFARILKGKPLEHEVKQELDKLEPYNYLQFSYHQVGEGMKAANAAYTYLSRHPEFEEMSDNLKFYEYHYPEVERMMKNQEMVNFELPVYNKLFQKGVIAYEAGEYENCLTNFEKALIGYYDAWNDCRKLCYNMEPQMDHFPSIWRNFADMEYKSAICQQECDEVVAAEAYNHRYVDPVGKILHYLQFCYYHTGNILQGANAVKSLTLISPSDEVAKLNLEFYMNKLVESGNQEFQIRFRDDIVRYLHQKQQLNNLVHFGDNYLTYRDEDTVDEDNETDQIVVDKDTIKKMINFDDITF